MSIFNRNKNPLEQEFTKTYLSTLEKIIDWIVDTGFSTENLGDVQTQNAFCTLHDSLVVYSISQITDSMKTKKALELLLNVQQLRNDEPGFSFKTLRDAVVSTNKVYEEARSKKSVNKDDPQEPIIVALQSVAVLKEFYESSSYAQSSLSISLPLVEQEILGVYNHFWKKLG